MSLNKFILYGMGVCLNMIVLSFHTQRFVLSAVIYLYAWGYVQYIEELVLNKVCLLNACLIILINLLVQVFGVMCQAY